MARRRRHLGLACALACLLGTGCFGYPAQHGIRWSAEDEIWQAEASQVKLRDAQSRVFDTSDRRGTLEAVVDTFHDLGFQIEVLDEALGIVSGKKFTGTNKPGASVLSADPTYYLYDEEALVTFSRSYRRWGPFYHRSDLVRLTVTVRTRNEGQLVVRAAAQFSLQAVENPETYQAFFRTLERSMLSQRQARAIERAGLLADSAKGASRGPRSELLEAQPATPTGSVQRVRRP